MLKPYAGSAVAGLAAFLCSLAAAFLAVVVVYGLYDWADAFHRSRTMQKALAYTGFGVVSAVGVATLFGAALWIARRWRLSALTSVVIAALLGGIASNEFLSRMSLLNDCVLDYSFPYDISGCD